MIGELQPFASLKQSKDIKIEDSGLYAVVDIPPKTTLLSIQHRHTICLSNIPQEFKQMLMPINHHRFVSKQTQIQKQINVNNELLLLYLIYLRHCKQQQIYKQWFDRPLTAMYFFSRKNIELSQNYDLLIDYVAQHNHIHEITHTLYNLLAKMQLLQLLFGTVVSQQVFIQNYEWSYHFINNRSFGYTEQYTVIPTFDMINHSAINSNVAQLLSNESYPTKQELQYIIGSKQSLISYESDNESQEDGVQAEKNRVLNQHFYYHIVSTGYITAGEEILLEYGNRNNKFLLQGYGFVEKNNPYDSLIIYVDSLSDRIYYDSVQGQTCKQYKLKRHIFDFELLIHMKKYYYQKKYNKDVTKAKIIWSKPKDREFQTYFFRELIGRMVKYQPQLHIFDFKLKGALELSMFQSQRLAIYRTNIAYLNKLLSVLTPYVEDWIEKTCMDVNLPACLQEYLILLQQL